MRGPSQVRPMLRPVGKDVKNEMDRKSERLKSSGMHSSEQLLRLPDAGSLARSNDGKSVVSSQLERVGVGDGNRTRNVRSHSPVLCQLSYSHRV